MVVLYLCNILKLVYIFDIMLHVEVEWPAVYRNEVKKDAFISITAGQIIF